MTSLSTYDNIEIGDTLIEANRFGTIKEGVVASVRKWNGCAMRVNFTDGSWTELSKYRSRIALSVEEN
jgi:hypothetical protein